MTKPPFPPARRSAVAPFMAMDVLREASALAAQGRSIMRLEVGEPGASPPAAVRDEGLAAAGRAGVVTYSRKVFVPLTTLCRDRCHYCTFVDTPAQLMP